jgi:hypothetical protein
LCKCLFIVQWDFALVFYLQIRCTLISLTSFSEIQWKQWQQISYIIFFFNCCTRDTLWHLQKFLQYIKYIVL